MLFILASIIDLSMTFYMYVFFSNSKIIQNGLTAEDNLVARYVLGRYGVYGLIAHKLIWVIITCIIIYIINHKKQKTGLILSAFAFIVTMAVAIYGMIGLVYCCYME
jgi:hypothetical protein